MRTCSDMKTSIKTIIGETKEKIKIADGNMFGVMYAHRKKNLEVLLEYLETHKVEIETFIKNDLENRG